MQIFRHCGYFSKVRTRRVIKPEAIQITQGDKYKNINPFYSLQETNVLQFTRLSYRQNGIDIGYKYIISSWSKRFQSMLRCDN